MAKAQIINSGKTKPELNSKKTEETKKKIVTTPVAVAKQKASIKDNKSLTAKVESKGGQLKGAVAAAKGMVSAETKTTGKQTKSAVDLEPAKKKK